MTSMRDRMLAGEPYVFDDQLRDEGARARGLYHRFNTMDPSDEAEARAVLRELLGSLGDDTEIRPPFYCEYGAQTFIGARSFVNFGAVVLDSARVSIGDDVRIGPYVQLLTATHPTDPVKRRDGCRAYHDREQRVVRRWRRGRTWRHDRRQHRRGRGRGGHRRSARGRRRRRQPCADRPEPVTRRRA
jgi:hypothetical protein